MNIIHFTGRIGKDAETRSTSKGEVCSFSVAVQQGISRDAKAEWYRCSIWGQRGSNLVSHLTKGAKVSVCGTLAIGEYDGKPQFNVNVLEIDPFCGGKSDAAPKEYGNAVHKTPATGGGSPFDPDLDDDVPF
jgi:single-strand DNA-binding protein